jgi:hypothetical protein
LSSARTSWVGVSTSAAQVSPLWCHWLTSSRVRPSSYFSTKATRTASATMASSPTLAPTTFTTKPQSFVAQESFNIRPKYNASVTTYGLKSKKLDAPVSNTTSAANLALYAARKDADAVVLAEQIDFTAIGIGALATDFLETELNDLVSSQATDLRRPLNHNQQRGRRHGTLYHTDNWRVSYFTSVVDPYTISI